jgi:hypothetical protein
MCSFEERSQVSTLVRGDLSSVPGFLFPSSPPNLAGDFLCDPTTSPQTPTPLQGFSSPSSLSPLIIIIILF